MPARPAGWIDARFPGAVERLSQYPGLGFALARDARGPLCYYQGVVLRIPPPGPTGCPLRDRPDRALAVQVSKNCWSAECRGYHTVWAVRAVGVYRIPRRAGGHAGPSEGEPYGFVLASPRVRFDFASVSGVRDLYPLFTGDQERARELGEGAWVR